MVSKSLGAKLIDAGVWTGLVIIGFVVVTAVVASLVLVFPNLGQERGPGISLCPRNLHNVAIALEMYGLDYGGYPETLGGYVRKDHGQRVIPMERTTDRSSLYPEYIKRVVGFHCPKSGNNRTDAVVKVLAGSKIRDYYAYDSYDVFYSGVMDTGESVTVGSEAVRYAKSWAADEKSVGKYPACGAEDSVQLRAHDYKRQLKLKKPSKDTVVTWCSYHRGGSAKSKIPVLFLDGHSDLVPARDAEGEDGRGGSRWRTSPNL